MIETLQRLVGKGVRFGSIIDIGCADGVFALNLLHRGLLPGAVPLNIDANALYEHSLKEIAAVAGGHYRIAAISDFIGEIELTTAAHPYWASVRPQGDPYWQRVNGLAQARVTVPATTLDRLVEELALPPPYLLKMDVQGAEASVLRGAAMTLARTHVLVCEADVDDFQAINSAVTGVGFHLYDLVSINRTADGTLGWFYPVYVHEELDFVRPKAFWNEADNARVIEMQVERRKSHLEFSARALAEMRSRRAADAQLSAAAIPKTGRNGPCPCGSARKYKHCCGAHVRD